jgi:hypothetical protein
MLNADDQATFLSVRELIRVVRDSKRPLVFWIGAGTSKWLGYALWKEFALDLRREFSKFAAGFDNLKALKLIDANLFPRFFQQCRDLDRARYYRFLSNAFLPRAETPLYKRFADTLAAISPLRILTTNIDEALEQRLPDASVYQRSDFSGCIEQLESGKSFIAKLHGSRSAIESAVFTHDDYESLKADTSFINTLKHLFAVGTVVFLGYSVTDEYLIDIISDNSKDMSLFGAGPHFVVSPDFKGSSSLHKIGYLLKRFPDHRSAITVLDVIREVEVRKGTVAPPVTLEPKKAEARVSPLGDKTAYFLSDFMPPGTWQNSVTAQLENAGVKLEMTVGLGFTTEEVPSTESTAPHDLAVGLICFDYVYFPLSALGRVHAFLGSEFFWRLVEADVIRFVHLLHEPVIMATEGALIGDIGLVSISKTSAGVPESTGTYIRRQLTSAPGKEGAAERLFSDLENRVVPFDEAGKIEMASLVRASLMMPDVARLLGIGEAILPTQVPKWLMFPYLRMAHLVHTGAVCDHLGLQAAKIPFGGERLTSAAFGVQPAAESADQYASYVLSGRFDTNLGVAVIGQAEILHSILKFRSTSEGEAFRREVRDQLLSDRATEFSASINAGLARNIPLSTLQKAHDKLSSLMTEKVRRSPVPAVWTDALHSDMVTRYWRARSRSLLLGFAKQRSITGNDECLCGSGDKLRLCCLLPLRD